MPCSKKYGLAHKLYLSDLFAIKNDEKSVALLQQFTDSESWLLKRKGKAT